MGLGWGTCVLLYTRTMLMTGDTTGHYPQWYKTTHYWSEWRRTINTSLVPCKIYKHINTWTLTTCDTEYCPPMGYDTKLVIAGHCKWRRAADEVLQMLLAAWCCVPSISAWFHTLQVGTCLVLPTACDSCLWVHHQWPAYLTSHCMAVPLQGWRFPM